MSVYQPGQKVLTQGTDITDNMLIPIDTGGAVAASVKAEALAEYVQEQIATDLPLSKVTALSSLTTITVGGMTGANIPCVNLTGTAAPVTVYFPPATEIVAALAALNQPVGTNYQMRVANLISTTGIGTLAASTGITLSGLATLTGQNSYATFNVAVVSATAVTITRVG